MTSTEVFAFIVLPIVVAALGWLAAYAHLRQSGKRDVGRHVSGKADPAQW